VAQRWVETGGAVEAMYHSVRADASDHARLRNTYFQQATQAFQVKSVSIRPGDEVE
jgi:hypothetical protein